MEQGAAATRKPKLNEAEKVIGRVLADRNSDPRAHLLRANWRTYMREAFELTREQEAEFAAISREEAQKIQGAFITALEHGGQIKLRVEEPAELEIRVNEVDEEVPEGADPTIFKKDKPGGTIGGDIFHCHTAKKLKDWKCHWGPVEPSPDPQPELPPDSGDPLDPPVPPPPGGGGSTQK